NRSSHETLREILALNKLHHQRADASAFFKAMNVRDVRMVQRCEDLRLPLEAGEAIRIVGEGIGEDFQRDVAIQLCVAGAIHLAHAARTEGGEDFVRAEMSAGG